MDGLVLQMRFVRQLPMQGAALAVNLAHLRATCEAAPPGSPPPHCALVGAGRAVALALAGLALIYWLERRTRRLWSQQHHFAAAGAGAAPAR